MKYATMKYSPSHPSLFQKASSSKPPPSFYDNSGISDYINSLMKEQKPKEKQPNIGNFQYDSTGKSR